MRKLMRFVSVVLLITLSSVPFGIALAPWNVSSSQFGRNFFTTSIVVDNWLYIDGGESYPRGATSFGDIKFAPTLSIDLSSSWTTSSLTINAIDRPAGLAYFKHEALWWIPRLSSFLLFGGQPYTATTTYSIWALKPDGNGGGTWSQQFGSSDSIWQSLTWPAYGSVAASSTTGYILGGFAQFNNTSGSITGMVELEFESGQWSNITTAGQYSASGMSVGGSAQFVPSFGKAGILVLLGGDTPLSTFSSGNTLRSLSNITVYDPTSKLWYSQTATGDVPASRIDICIAGAQSTNSSTYEIFVYGGWIGSFSSTDNSDSHNVYILTLPAFRWIRAAASTLPRAGSSCQVVNSQMISFGGWDPTGTLPFTTADPFTYGVGVFDLTSLSWNNGFNASARPYMRSDLVTAFYAKNALSPASWDNPLLAAVFANSSATQATTSATGAPTSLPTPSGSSSSNPSQTASATSLGPIIGSVIGGVVLIAALTALWWFCFRNRKSPPSQPAELEPQQTIINPKPERMVELGPPRPWELNTPNEAPRELDTGAPQNPTGPVVYHEVHG